MNDRVFLNEDIDNPEIINTTEGNRIKNYFKNTEERHRELEKFVRDICNIIPLSDKKFFETKQLRRMIYENKYFRDPEDYSTNRESDKLKNEKIYSFIINNNDNIAEQLKFAFNGEITKLNKPIQFLHEKNTNNQDYIFKEDNIYNSFKGFDNYMEISLSDKDILNSITCETFININQKEWVTDIKNIEDKSKKFLLDKIKNIVDFEATEIDEESQRELINDIIEFYIQDNGISKFNEIIESIGEKVM